MIRGFTLLEVMVAVAILALSFGALLETQVSSLSSVARARSLTVATLLAKSKMIDIEQKLFDEGFKVGDEDEDGNFGDEGYEAIIWKYTVAEVELDLGGLGSLCDGMGGEDSKAGEPNGCESMLSGLGGTLDGFTKELGQSLRQVELTVTWPEGSYKESMSVHALVSREDNSK